MGSANKPATNADLLTAAAPLLITEYAVMAHPQTWRCVGPSHWQRGLSSMEAYFDLVGRASAAAFGRETAVGSSCIKLSGPVSAAGLREAWKRLRFIQPGIATTIEDGSMHYRVPSKEELDAWVKKTFFIGSGCFEDFFLEMEPIDNCTMYWLPDSSELVARSAHWKGDGVGVLHCWNEFLSLIGASHPVEWGKEVANLAPTADALWNRLPMQNPTAGLDALGKWAKNIPGVGPPSEVGKALPSQCRFTRFIFSKEDTSDIIKYATVSPTPDIHAAFALANAQHQDRSNPSSMYATFGSYGLRHHVDKSFPGSTRPDNLYYISLPMVLPVSNFEQMSRELSNQYKDYGNRLAGPERNEVLSTSDALFQISQAPEFFQGPVSRDALFSNVGVVEKFLQTKHNNIEIVDIQTGMDIVAGLAILAVFTFKGQLRLMYSYNEAYQRPEDIQMLLQTTARILKHQCRVVQARRSVQTTKEEIGPGGVQVQSRL